MSYWRKDANGVYAACKWENNNCVQQDGTYTHDDIFKWDDNNNKFVLRNDQDGAANLFGKRMEFWKGDDKKNPNCDNGAEGSCRIWSCAVRGINEDGTNVEMGNKCYPDHDKVRIVKISGMKHENDC